MNTVYQVKASVIIIKQGSPHSDRVIW